MAKVLLIAFAPLRPRGSTPSSTASGVAMLIWQSTNWVWRRVEWRRLSIGTLGHDMGPMWTECPQSTTSVQSYRSWHPSSSDNNSKSHSQPPLPFETYARLMSYSSNGTFEGRSSSSSAQRCGWRTPTHSIIREKEVALYSTIRHTRR